MTDVDLTQSHVFVDGRLVSAKVERIVQAIKDYEPEIDVQWIPPEAREPDQAAFAIIHRPVGKPDYVCFYVKDESEFDERVLLRLIYNDQRNGERQMTELEAFEKTQALLQKQAWLDQVEEANDIAAFALRTKLNKFTLPDPNNPGRIITIRE